MAEPGAAWKPDPDSWGPNEYARAKRIVDSPDMWRGDPEKLTKLKFAVSYYERKDLPLDDDTSKRGAPTAQPDEAPNPAFRPVTKYADPGDPGDFPQGDSPEAIRARLSDPRPGPPGTMEPATAGPEETSVPEALGRGAADTASFGFSDEAAGFGAWLADKLDRTRGETPEASSYSAMRDQFRADDAQALKDQPTAFRTGQVAGALGTAAAPLGPGAAAANAGRLARAGRIAAGGAIAGGASAAGASEAEATEEPLELAKDTAVGAGVGAAAAPVVAGAVSLAARGAPKLAKGAADAASRWRAAATGFFGSDLEKLTAKYGDDYAVKLGQEIERMGLHERQVPADAGAMRKLLAKVLPSTPTVYRDNAARATKQLGEQLGKSIDDATAQNVTYPRDALVGRLRAIQRSYGTATPEQRASREQVRELIKTIKKDYGEYLSPKELHSLKKQYESGAGLEPGQVVTASEGRTRKMYRKAASAPRRALQESIAEQAEQTTTAPQFAEANRDYRTARTVENTAGKRVARELGNQPVSLPAAATGSIPGAIAMEPTKRGGKDVIADVLRGTAHLARGSSTVRKLADAKPVRALAGSRQVARLPEARGSAAATPAYAQDGEPADRREQVAAFVRRSLDGKKRNQQQGGEYDTPAPQPRDIDRGAQDPKHGPAIAAAPEEKKAVVYMTAIKTDPEFRERMRRLDQDEDE